MGYYYRKKYYRRKRTRKDNAIRQRHRRSRTSSINLITPKKSHWMCKSTNTNDTTSYKITSTGVDCGCDVRCERCDICIHEYECSCPDFSGRDVICKHIHILCRYRAGGPEFGSSGEEDSSDEDSSEEEMYYRRTGEEYAIELRHERSIGCPTTLITPEEDYWMCKSTNNDDTATYKITKERQDCGCQLRCEPCDACIHEYACSCPDFSDRDVMCKHIHILCRYLADTFGESSDKDDSSDESDSLDDENDDDSSDGRDSSDDDSSGDDFGYFGGIRTKQNYAIELRHDRSMGCPINLITPKKTFWMCKSTNKNDTATYKIAKQDPDCGCKRRCKPCDACIHEYECSCPDNSGRDVMCKHIHILCRYLAHTRGGGIDETKKPKTENAGTKSLKVKKPKTANSKTESRVKVKKEEIEISATASLVKVKKEKTENAEAESLIQVKKEKIENTEAESLIQVKKEKIKNTEAESPVQVKQEKIENAEAESLFKVKQEKPENAEVEFVDQVKKEKAENTATESLVPIKQEKIEKTDVESLVQVKQETPENAVTESLVQVKQETPENAVTESLFKVKQEKTGNAETESLVKIKKRKIQNTTAKSLVKVKKSKN